VLLATIVGKARTDAVRCMKLRRDSVPPPLLVRFMALPLPAAPGVLLPWDSEIGMLLSIAHWRGSLRSEYLNGGKSA